MNRLRAYGGSYSGMLLGGLTVGGAGLVLSCLLLIDRAHFEPLLPYVLPTFTSVIFRTALSYRPEQYFWIAAYVGLFSAALTATMGIIFLRRLAQNARIDAALKKKVSAGQARGEPLEP